jgi:hypothetical protein
MLRLTYSCLQDAKPQCFANPTIPTEDLARGWDGDHLDLFLTRVRSSLDNIVKAVNAPSESEAVNYYKQAFGDTFPS